MDDKLLPYLYAVNKYAKQYENNAEKRTEEEIKQQFRTRRNCLYELKKYVLKELYESDEIDNIEIHKINNKKYYCFFIDGFSFHSPQKEWDISINTSRVKILNNFEKDSQIKELDVTEQEVLQWFAENYVNINKFIDSKIERKYPWVTVSWQNI